jgi:hypothetical protein
MLFRLHLLNSSSRVVWGHSRKKTQIPAMGREVEDRPFFPFAHSATRGTLQSVTAPFLLITRPARSLMSGLPNNSWAGFILP